MNNTNNSPRPYTPPAARTEMLGIRLREATVRLNPGHLVRITDGCKVGMSRWYDCGDGGDISGWFTGTVVRIARGTESGMHGTEALLITVKWDRVERGQEAESTFAARHVLEVDGKNQRPSGWPHRSNQR